MMGSVGPGGTLDAATANADDDDSSSSSSTDGPETLTLEMGTRWATQQCDRFQGGGGGRG
eukprot:2679635-Pyramimonas_sp.AAC.2